MVAFFRIQFARKSCIHRNLYFFTLGSFSKYFYANNNWCAAEQRYMQTPLTVAALKLKRVIVFNVNIFFSFAGSIWKRNYKISHLCVDIHDKCHQCDSVLTQLCFSIPSQQCWLSGVSLETFCLSNQRQIGGAFRKPVLNHVVIFAIPFGSDNAIEN